jgi:hypothetical protein
LTQCNAPRRAHKIAHIWGVGHEKATNLIKVCGFLMWSRWSVSNRRPAVYETAALPLSYTGKTRLPVRAYSSIDGCAAQTAMQITYT